MKPLTLLKLSLTLVFSIGTLNLFAQEKTLKEVAIKGTKNIIKQEVDRITYDLQADPESKVSKLLEMMRKLPFVTLDADQNVLLKGNTNFRILLNGKPSSMLERDLKNVLRSMPASTIQRIEVYTTPPARFDAEGLGGVINIITIKKIADGYNGTLNANVRQPLGVGAGTSLTIKAGKFGASLFAGANKNDNPVTATYNQLENTGTNPSLLVQNGNATSGSKSAYMGTDLSYEIDSINLISGQINLNGNRNGGSSFQNSLLNRTNEIVAYDVTNASTSRGDGFDGSVNYQRGFKGDKSKLLTFSYRYWGYDNGSTGIIAFGNRVNYGTANYNQYNATYANEHTVQLDYVQRIKKVQLEAGVKVITRKNNADFELDQFNPFNNLFVRNDTLSNQFNSRQYIMAGYNTWQFLLFKKLEVKAGVRVEQTTMDVDFISSITNVHQNYLNVLPSLALNLPMKNNTSLNAGFSQRIKRPGINKLNPYIDRSNPNFLQSGNPDLQASVINDIRVGYSLTRKANVNISMYYDFAHGFDIPITTLDQVTNIAYTTFKNVGHIIGIGTNVNLSYPITKQWNVTNNINAIYFEMDGQLDGEIKTNQFFNFSVSTSTGYNFNNGWRLGLNVDIIGRNPTGLQGSTNGFISSAFNISKQLIKNKLSFSASVRNPFTRYRDNTTTTSGRYFNQVVSNQQYFSGFNASLNYNFGRLKDNIKKAKRGINNDDGAR